MHIDFRWIKDAGSTFDRDFIRELVRHFGLSTFIETGTFMGDTVASILDIFESVATIELAPELAARARERFALQPQVLVIEADSPEGLKTAFSKFPYQSALIWLDAHYSGGQTACGEGNTPVLAELDRILTLRDGRDVILIDDVRLFWPIPKGFLDHSSHHGYPMLSRVAELFDAAACAYDVVLLGDILLALPRSMRGRFFVSPVAAACTRSRLKLPSSPVDRAVEQMIKTAATHERMALLEIPPGIGNQSKYGLGAHYYYWRGLIREEDGRYDDVIGDFELAFRCGVIPSDRIPKKTVIQTIPQC